MSFTKILRTVAVTLILILIAGFYTLELKRNWAALQNFKLVINTYYLVIALSLCILSSLLETYIWEITINRYLVQRQLSFPRSIAIVNGSSLLKYLPGRIWMYTAQLSLLKKYDISKSKILYVNLICIIGSITVSLYFGFIYLGLYTDLINHNLFIFSMLILILFNILYVKFNDKLMNIMIALVNKYFNKNIQPMPSSTSMLINIQVMYVFSWLLAAVAGYYLVKGIGLTTSSMTIFSLLASMSLSWVAGYLAVVTPGGLGVREGVMLLMLNHVVDVQTVLLFPIVSRILLLLAEAFLGLLALLIGIRWNVFSYE